MPIGTYGYLCGYQTPVLHSLGGSSEKLRGVVGLALATSFFILEIFFYTICILISIMKQYLDFLQHVLDHGVDRDNGTDIKDRSYDPTAQVNTRSVFGYQFRCDLSEGFPLLTTKKVFTRMIIHELLWFISGDTNIQYLVQNKVPIWNEWAFQCYLNETGLAKDIETYSDAWKQEMDRFIEKVKDDDAFAEKW